MGYFTKPTIVAQITNYCNARCEHCFNAYHVQNVGSTVPLDIDAFFDFLDRFSNQLCAYKPYVGISGGGEPTQHPRFHDLTNGLANRRFYYSVVTNGLHWQRWLEPLSKSKAVSCLYRVYFSLYGEKSVHDKVTGVESFDHMIQAIKFCRKNNINCQLHVAVNKMNIDQVPEIIRIMAEEDINCGCTLFPVFSTSYLHEKGLMLDQQDMQLLRRYKNNVAGRISVCGIDAFHTPAGRAACGELDGDKFSVNYNGELGMCCSLIGLSYNQNQKDIFGTIYDTDLSETFCRREDIKAAWRKEYVRALGQKEIQSYPLTKCNWCIQKFFDKIPKEEKEPLRIVAGEKN